MDDGDDKAPRDGADAAPTSLVTRDVWMVTEVPGPCTTPPDPHGCTWYLSPEHPPSLTVRSTTTQREPTTFTMRWSPTVETNRILAMDVYDRTAREQHVVTGMSPITVTLDLHPGHVYEMWPMPAGSQKVVVHQNVHLQARGAVAEVEAPGPGVPADSAPGNRDATDNSRGNPPQDIPGTEATRGERAHTPQLGSSGPQLQERNLPNEERGSQASQADHPQQANPNEDRGNHPSSEGPRGGASSAEQGSSSHEHRGGSQGGSDASPGSHGQEERPGQGRGRGAGR